jgi:hypothetical protein
MNEDMLRIYDDDNQVYYHPLQEPVPITQPLFLHGQPPPVGMDVPSSHPEEMTTKKQNVGTGTTPAARGQDLPSLQTLDAVAQSAQLRFQQHKAQWRASALILQDLHRAPSAFTDQLTSKGLMKKSRVGVLGLIRVRTILR